MLTMQVNRHVFANGLRLLHYQDAATKLVTVNTMYDVGSKDEHPDHTGFAHLFEHLMFAGSAHVSDFDRVVQEASGEDNAWTGNDVTDYYITVPSYNLETALWVESDRMLALDINRESLRVQKQVVREEFKQRFLNQPYGDASLLLRRLAYGSHPYAWPTIGKSEEHIKQFRLKDVRAFYAAHYAPDNAVIAVCGDVSFAQAVDLVGKWFGDIPARDVPARQMPAWAPQTHPRRLQVRRDVPVEAVYKLWRAPSFNQEGYPACDLLTDVLAGGRSSRLTRHLVREEHLFNDLDIYVGGEGEVGAGTIQFSGKPAEGVSFEAAEAGLQRELDRLAANPVTEEELLKVKNKYASAFLFKNTNCQHIATQLCWYEILSEAGRYMADFDRTMAVTAEEIRQQASEVFREENCSTLCYVPLAK